MLLDPVTQLLDALVDLISDSFEFSEFFSVIIDGAAFIKELFLTEVLLNESLDILEGGDSVKMVIVEPVVDGNSVAICIAASIYIYLADLGDNSALLICRDCVARTQ